MAGGKQLVNKNLISLKCVLFCFLSGVLVLLKYFLPDYGEAKKRVIILTGIGCIYPFLPLHMLSVGLDRGESRLVSAIAPCVALLGPALLGPLIDKLSVGRGSTGGGSTPSGSGRLLRIITAICLILSALFYTLLLALPYTERHDPRRPQVLFKCNSSGAYVMQEVCAEDMSCKRWSGEKSGVLALGVCEYGCADQNMTWEKAPFINREALSLRDKTLTEEDDEDFQFETNPPHLCYNNKCMVYMKHENRMRMPLTLLAPEPHDDNSTDASRNWCTYRTSGSSHCFIPPERLAELQEENEECNPAVRCKVLDPYDEPDGVLANAECRFILGDPVFTFWSYFIIRVLADVWPTAALALLGAACVIATRETSLGRGDVGRQLAFGTIGLVIFPPLAALADMPESPYIMPFLMHAVFMLIGALILLVDKNMPLSTPEWWWHTATGVLTMPMNVVRRYGAETAAVFAVVALLGVLWSGIDAYLPWTVLDLNGNATDVSLTMTIGALPAIPALWWAEAVVDYIGHSNIFIMAFTFYCVRYTGLAYSTDFNWIVVIELMEVFTLSLVWVTAMLYFRHLVPRKYTATGQALPVIAHFCLGRCIGAIIGGVVTLQPALESARDVYRGLAVAALLCAVVYLALYHLLLAPRCASPVQPPPTHLLQGLNTNGASNGTYSPMRVYHEERSRKGHFRY